MAKKKSNKLLYILLAVFAVVLVIAIVGKKQGWFGGGNAVEVEIAEVGYNDIVEQVSASGTVQPEVEVTISPEVPGEIIELHVEEGDSVKPGELLLRIRPDNFQSALSRMRATYSQQQANLSGARSRLAQAEAQFEQAKADFERNKDLFEEKVISEADYQQALASYRVAEQEIEAARQSVEASRYQLQSAAASVKEAEENLELTSIYAPVEGIISKLSVERGERVVGTSQMAGTELLRIADLSKMEVRVDVNENDIIRVHQGDTAIIDVDAYGYMDRKFQGVVTAIANTANQKASPDAVTEFEVKVRVLNESYEDLIGEEGIQYPFRPGMTASVDIITKKKSDALSVPLASVTTRSEKNKKASAGNNGNDDDEAEQDKGRQSKEEVNEIVFVNEGGVAVMKEVKTGISDFDHIEIIEGLEAGDQVIAGPYIAISRRLEDGDKLEVEEQEGSEQEDEDTEQED